MEKRLKLAKNLLADDGVIFISIDDNEQAELKLLCDSIFYEKNFVSTMVWAGNRTGKNDSKNIRNVHEYVLVYFKVQHAYG
jgi:adenine-specific DNA-methyltransferase